MKVCVRPNFMAESYLNLNLNLNAHQAIVMGTRWNGESTKSSGYQSADLRFGMRPCRSEFHYPVRKCVKSSDQHIWIYD
jgi:hypothetical protein